MNDNKKNKAVTFYQNPFYDYLFGSFGISVPSTRSGFKHDPIAMNAIPNPISKSVREFREYMKQWLSTTPEPKWPCKGRILIAMHIGLASKEYSNKDIDNISKSLLDALKGIVFEDDIQVDALHVVKFLTSENGFFIGIKELEDNAHAWYYPIFYRGTPWDAQ